MKKINLPLIAILAFFASLMFASCKKDYTCACTVTVPFFFDTVVNVEMKDMTKKQAKVACENNDETIKTVSNAVMQQLLSGFFEDSSTGGLPITLPQNLVSSTCELD